MANTRTTRESQRRQQTENRSTTNGRQQSQSSTQVTLNTELVNQILSGLAGGMTDEQISQYAENLLRPQLNAQREAAQQNYETTKLAKEQEIANLARSLEQAVGQQNAAYRQNMADVETAALRRGMGRSSYTMQTLANQGSALAAAVQQLTDENARQSAQIQSQITQAQQQNAQTQGRLNTDYAASLAAKIQEMRQQQTDTYNQNYLTVTSRALGQQTTGTTTQQQNTTNTGTSNTTENETTENVDIVNPPLQQPQQNNGGTQKKKTTKTEKPKTETPKTNGNGSGAYGKNVRMVR